MGASATPADCHILISFVTILIHRSGALAVSAVKFGVNLHAGLGYGW
jgi:hypothetical protein